MLTKDNKDWLKRFSNKKRISIIPFDSIARSIFEQEKRRIKNILSNSVKVVHRGATSLGISGQGDVDVYIPVRKDKFDAYLRKLIQVYGEPISLYPGERAKFNKIRHKTLTEIILINTNTEAWKKGVVFERYLKAHSQYLKEYKLLKENCDGMTLREYYTRKTEFINQILTKITSDL